MEQHYRCPPVRVQPDIDRRAHQFREPEQVSLAVHHADAAGGDLRTTAAEHGPTDTRGGERTDRRLLIVDPERLTGAVQQQDLAGRATRDNMGRLAIDRDPSHLEGEILGPQKPPTDITQRDGVSGTQKVRERRGEAVARAVQRNIGIRRPPVGQKPGLARLAKEVEIVIGDAMKTLADEANTFDLIVMDLTDPGDAADSPANALYSKACFELIRSHLSPDGLMTAHIGSPFYHPERFSNTLADLASVFPQVAAYKAFMPIYGAEWGMACASNHADPRTASAAEISQRLTARAITGLRFYTPRVHSSLFAWPAYAENLGA